VPVARQPLARGMQSLASDLERVDGRERALIRGDDRHDLRAEAGELLPEQVQAAVGDRDCRRLVGISLQRDLEQAIVRAACESIGHCPLKGPLGIVQPVRHQLGEQGGRQNDADRTSKQGASA
jgi:hypothetical protein